MDANDDVGGASVSPVRFPADRQYVVSFTASRDSVAAKGRYLASTYDKFRN